MKKIFNAKNKPFYLAALSLFACLFLFFGYLLHINKPEQAFADTPALMSFESGASVRIDTEEDKSGLRFTAYLQKSLYDSLTTADGDLNTGAELGMIIVPSNYIAACEDASATDYFAFFDAKGIARSKISIPFTPQMLDGMQDGSYAMRGTLVSIYPQNYNREFRAVAYYKLSANDSYTYLLHTDARSVSYVSVQAIQQEDTRPQGDYTDKELDVLYMHTGGEIPRVLYDASKQNHTQLLTVNNSNVGVEQKDNKFRFAVKAKQTLVITPQFLEYAHLSSYEGGHIYFTVKTDAKNASCSVTGGSSVTLPQNTETTITVPVSNYTSNNNFKITIYDLAENNSVWISDIAICVKHSVLGWSYPDEDSHSGRCDICNAGIEGEHKLTALENPDNDHHIQSCSVCNVQVSGECTYEKHKCTVCGQTEWDTWVFAVLDDDNILHIFNRKVKSQPNKGTVLSLDDGSTLTVTSDNLYGIPYYRLQDSNTTIYSYDNNEEIGFKRLVKDKKGWEKATEAVKVIVEDETLPNNTNAWFSGFKNCTSMDLRKLNTANATDMKSMFSYCNALTTLDVSNFDTANVTNMSSMFSGCNALTSLDVSRFNTANVTDMSGMFSGCGILTSLDLSSFNVEKVTDMTNMFYNCNALTSLDVSSFTPSETTSMYRMFYYCSSLTSLDLSNFNVEKVENMGEMFIGCSSLTSLDLSSFNTANVNAMGNMFQNCSSLKTLTFGENFNIKKITTTIGMFYGCSSLTSLDVSNFDTANVTDMRNMFDGCSSLTSLDVSRFNTANVTDMSGMFKDCSSLKTINVSNFDTTKVTNMSYMFDGCKLLSTIDVSGLNVSKVTNISYMFRNCETLKNLNLSNFSAKNITNMTETFSGCSALQRIIVNDAWSISNKNALTLPGSPNTFTGCTKLVGGNGTIYNESYTTSKYAHIDGNELIIFMGSSQESVGYFTSETQAKKLGLL